MGRRRTPRRAGSRRPRWRWHGSVVREDEVSVPVGVRRGVEPGEDPVLVDGDAGEERPGQQARQKLTPAARQRSEQAYVQTLTRIFPRNPEHGQEGWSAVAHDPESRHVYKTEHTLRDRFRSHVVVEPDTGLITAARNAGGSASTTPVARTSESAGRRPPTRADAQGFDGGRHASVSTVDELLVPPLVAGRTGSNGSEDPACVDYTPAPIWSRMRTRVDPSVSMTRLPSIRSSAGGEGPAR